MGRPTCDDKEERDKVQHNAGHLLMGTEIVSTT